MIDLRLIGFLVFAVLASALAVPPAQAQDTRQPSGITVTGHGEVMGMPDIAYVSLGILNRDASASKAASENARVAQAIKDALKAAGIAERDIQTQNYSIQQWMEYPPTGQPRQLGYEVRNTVRATVRDISKVGAVIDAGVKAGANEVQGISFDIANDQSLRQQALTAAVRDARVKAETIASALKVKLGNPLNVTESAYRPPVPLYRAEVAAAPPGTPISPGQLTISQDVTVTYAIIP